MVKMRDLCCKFCTQMSGFICSIRRNLLLKCAPQPKIANYTKTLILGVQVHSSLSVLIPLKISSLLHGCVYICNRF